MMLKFNVQQEWVPANVEETKLSVTVRVSLPRWIIRRGVKEGSYLVKGDSRERQTGSGVLIDQNIWIFYFCVERCERGMHGVFPDSQPIYRRSLPVWVKVWKVTRSYGNLCRCVINQLFPNPKPVQRGNRKPSAFSSTFFSIYLISTWDQKYCRVVIHSRRFHQY